MILETELSEKLNSELEAAGISVSEALIAKTLAAVKTARATEESMSRDAEWGEVSEENVNKLIELAESRKGRYKGIGRILFRAATVMAACFVLVVGGFALRFSTMRMGKDSAAPMAMEENSSARNGTVMYAADMMDESVVATAEGDMKADSDAVMVESEEECKPAETPEMQEEVKLLTEQLAQAESFEKEQTAQGTTVYRFVVRTAGGTEICYLVHENGEVEYAEMMSDGETGALLPYEGTENNTFRRAVLVWLKENGY